MALPLRIQHANDPRTELMMRMKPVIQSINPMGARVLVAVYKPDDDAKTKSGLILVSKTTDEYRWQGKVGLVLALGPIAFTEDATHTWGDRIPKVGDWVCFNIGDTRSADTSVGMVRFIEDTEVLAIVSDPDAVY